MKLGRVLKKIIINTATAQKKENRLKIDGSSILNAFEGFDTSNLNLLVQKGSTVIIESGVQINGNIIVKNNSKLLIHKKCRLQNVDIIINNASTVVLCEGSILNPQNKWKQYINCSDMSEISISKRSMIAAQLLVNYGGKLTIGEATSIGPFTQIRSQQKIEIGMYVLISYNVQIFDTNTHSIEWQERRAAIERGYPYGAAEVKRNKTAPVIIGDDVWIGSNVNISKGCSIGNRSIIGMGVNIGKGSIPANSKVISPPPRIISADT
jgi:acetyltransferase-like isoleucine patch superfamily enzyme